MNRLKELRKDKNKSQKEIAELLEVNEKTISRWEKGERPIKTDKAQQLADYFGVSVGYLLGYDEGGGQGKIYITKEIYDHIQKYSESFETIYDSQVYAHVALNHGTEVLDKVINNIKEDFYSNFISDNENESREESIKKVKYNIERSINDLLNAISYISGSLEEDLINFLSLDSEKRELLSPIIKLIANNPPTDYYAELLNKY